MTPSAGRDKIKKKGCLLMTREEINRKIRTHFKEIIYQITRYAEIVLSVVILLAIVMAGIPLFLELIKMPSKGMMGMDYFTEFLAHALSLVVGVEFVKMLCKHTAETVVEVLLFAIARQMVVEHYATGETLLGVISIAVLFAIRKFLLLREDDKTPRMDKF